MPRQKKQPDQTVAKLDAIGEPVTSFRSPKVPTYRLHKPSGQAIVTIAGKDQYLGTHGSARSHLEYQRRVAEWLSSGCPSSSVRDPLAAFKVEDLALAYWKYVKQSYAKETRDGTVAPMIRRLRRLFGSTLVYEFGPLRLKTFRNSLIDERIPPKHGGPGPSRRLSRRYVNRIIREVRRMFRWGVGEELVSPTVLHGLQAVEGLRMGRTDAPETDPVRPVPDAHVEAVLRVLPAVVADMVRVQRLTGMRPGELCAMTAGELDTTSDIWVFAPKRHKTAHHGKSRNISIGPRAQEILKRYLRTDLNAPLFTPEEAEQQRREEKRAARVTPMTPSQRAREAACAANPRRRYRPSYDTTSYGLAVRRACLEADVPAWSPNQLRHARATEVRKTFGLDAAGAVLGHAKLETTQIYAEKNYELAAQVAKMTG